MSWNGSAAPSLSVILRKTPVKISAQGRRGKTPCSLSKHRTFQSGWRGERACSDLISLIMKWDICALHSQTHRHGRVRRRLRQDFSPPAVPRNGRSSAGGAGASSAMALAPFLRLHLWIWTMAVKWRARFHFLFWLFVRSRGRSGMQNRAGGAPRRLPEL